MDPAQAPGLCNECGGPLCDDMSEGYMICVKCGLRHSQMFIYEPEWKDYQKMRDEGQEVTGDRAGRAMTEKEHDEIINGANKQNRINDLLEEVAKVARVLDLPRAGTATIKNWMKIYVEKTPMTRSKEYVAVAAIVLASWRLGHTPLWHSNIAYRLGLKDSRLRIVMRTFSLLLKPNMRFLDHNDHIQVAISAYCHLYAGPVHGQEISRLLSRYEKKYGSIELHKCMNYVLAASNVISQDGGRYMHIERDMQKRAKELGVGLSFLSLRRRFAPIV